MRTKCAMSDAFVRDCVFAYCASVAQHVYSLSAEHCFRLRNNAISDERFRDCALSTHSVFRPLDSHKARDLKPRMTTASREAPSPAQDEVLTELAGVGVFGPPRYRPPPVSRPELMLINFRLRNERLPSAPKVATVASGGAVGERLWREPTVQRVQRVQQNDSSAGTECRDSSETNHFNMIDYTNC